MKVFGQKPRPRVLVEGFNDDEFKDLRALAPAATWLKVGSVEDVRADEWDMLVTAYEKVDARPHMYVVAVGSRHFGSYSLPSGQGGVMYMEVVFGDSSIATEFVVPERLEPEVARLVQRRLLPAVQRRDENPVLREAFLLDVFGPRQTRESHLVPFLHTTEPKALAGCFRRGAGHGPEVWCLPEGMHAHEWVYAALQVWHRQDPERFPLDPGWRSSLAWLTPAEVSIQGDLNGLHEQRELALAEFDAREKELDERLSAARLSGDEGARRLLTAQSGDLVAAVEAALTQLGFAVSNRDVVNPVNDRLEDLWVTVPDDPGWLALAEVRGYGKGAAVSDLMRLGRFARRYLQDQGRPPTRLWYIANQFAGTDPGNRPAVLETNPNEVQAFAEDDGLVLDTVDLFRLIRQVELGEAETAAVRRSLRGVGRFSVS